MPSPPTGSRTPRPDPRGRISDPVPERQVGRRGLLRLQRQDAPHGIRDIHRPPPEQELPVERGAVELPRRERRSHRECPFGAGARDGNLSASAASLLLSQASDQRPPCGPDRTSGEMPARCASVGNDA